MKICACLFTLSASALLASCGPGPIATEDGGGTDGRSVELMAEAPDGTKLWRFWNGTTPIYFASGGAQWTRSCGKNCTRTDQVPTRGPAIGHGRALNPLAPAAAQ